MRIITSAIRLPIARVRVPLMDFAAPANSLAACPVACAERQGLAA